MALDRMALILKVGDQPAELSSQYKTMKEGFPISLIVERDWGQTLEEIFSDGARRVFAIVEVNPLMESYYMEMIQQLNADKETDPDLYRQRKKVLPLANLATKIGSSDLVDKLRSETESVPMIDGRALIASDFLDAATYTTKINRIEDKNVIFGGSHNVGSGETYTTLTAFAADVGTLTSNIEAVLTSDITETSVALINTALAGYEYKVTSDSESYGTPNVGHKISVNQIAEGVTINIQSSTGTFVLDKFYLKSIYASSTNYPLIEVNASYNSPIELHDIMFDGNKTAGDRHRYAVRFNNNAAAIDMWNCQAWDIAYTGFWINDINSGSVFENITAYNCTSYGYRFNTKSFTARNLVTLGSSTGDYIQETSMTSFTKCASSDTTGSEAGLRSLTASSLYDSLDDTNNDFLKITNGSTIDGAGTTSILTANTQGIRKNPRPNSNSKVSCGASESLPSGDLINLRGGFSSSLAGGFQ